MNQLKQSINALCIILFVAIVLAQGLLAQAESVNTVVIAEIQTGSVESSSEEFIELANISNSDVDISQWRIEYFSATAKNFDTPSRSIPLRGVLPAGERYLVASASYLVGIANDSFSAGLAATGGHLRLVDLDANNPTITRVRDLLGWGSAQYPEAVAAIAPPAGQSLQRKTDDNSGLVDTDNNSADFIIVTPTPQGFVGRPDEEDQAEEDIDSSTDDMTAVEPEADTVDESQPEEDNSTEALFAAPAYSLQLSELLPNPAAPQTDATDEFVELYNPNTVPVELTGYKLQTGTTYNHSFEFNDQVIAAQSFMAFYISETGAVLANSAGKARLIDPSGAIMSESADYTDATDGASWSLVDGQWTWTTTSTPNAANKLTLKTTESKAPVAAKTSSKKATTAKAKAKTAAAKAVKGASTVTGGAGSTQNESATENTKTATLHPAILAGVGGLAVLYAVYEYRQDIANAFSRFRRNRKTG